MQYPENRARHGDTKRRFLRLTAEFERSEKPATRSQNSTFSEPYRWIRPGWKPATSSCTETDRFAQSIGQNLGSPEGGLGAHEQQRPRARTEQRGLDTNLTSSPDRPAHPGGVWQAPGGPGHGPGRAQGQGRQVSVVICIMTSKVATAAESGQTTAYLRAAIVCLPVPSENCVSLLLQPPRNRPAVSGSVTYRDHELAVRMPSRSGAGWIVLIWRPNNATPIIMPRQPSSVAAVRAAQAVVDEILDGRGCA
jgi:hypothetical protein